MLKLWVFIGISVLLCNIFPIIGLTLILGLLLAVTCGTIHQKFVLLSSESTPALLLASTLTLITKFCNLLARVNLISEVEALRLPNFAALLIKPHPDVGYEKIQIRDDTINLIIYRPKVLKNNGLIVYAHGGGWVMFTARMFHSAVSWVAHQCQMVVVSVDYRRPPEHPFPAALNDVYYTVLWAQLNAQRLGIDPENVILMGDSAGGNLAAAASILHQDKATKNAPIKAQVLIYPVLGAYNYHHGSYKDEPTTYLRKYVSYYLMGDLSLVHSVGDPALFEGTPAYWAAVVEPAESSLLTPRRDLLPNRLDNLSNMYCFPLLDPDPRGLPPTYILTLARDSIRDDGQHYAAWLQHCGVPVTHVEEPRASHGFMFLYGSDTCALSHLQEIAQYCWTQVQAE